MVKSAVFLDRDGVLVRNVLRDGRQLAPRTLAEFSFYSDAAAGVARLRQAGFLTVVVTNQPDVGHGLISPETLAAMHQRLAAAMPLDAILTCTHRQDEGCVCRKPRPGLLRRAADDFGIDLTRSWIVGDRASDIAAGQAAGCRTVLIDHQTGDAVGGAPEVAFNDLAQAISYIVERSAGGRRNEH